MKPLGNYIVDIVISIIVYGAIAIASYPIVGVLAPIFFITIIGILVVVIPLKKEQETVYFTKMNQRAKIPTKNREDAGYDIYPCFSDEEIVIEPHQTKMIPTGLGSKMDKKYYFQLFERGSTGTKGIAQRSGVIDSGFRGEWKVPITNTTNHRIIISKSVTESKLSDGELLYPYNKAICQAVLLLVPDVYVKEITNRKYETFLSKRGTGMLGSSGK